MRVARPPSTTAWHSAAWRSAVVLLACSLGCHQPALQTPPVDGPFPSPTGVEEVYPEDVSADGIPTHVLFENTVFLPVQDREFVWNQLVDTVDDYFLIRKEERVRDVGGILTEGRIETLPLPGATLFEPWRNDSSPGFERWHSTLQSIRRQALIRLLPEQGGYIVEVTVTKELEDLDRPEFYSVGESTFRHDTTLVRREDRLAGTPVTLGWIAIGRDGALEQRILAEIRGRVTDAEHP